MVEQKCLEKESYMVTEVVRQLVLQAAFSFKCVLLRKIPFHELTQGNLFLGTQLPN